MRVAMAKYRKPLKMTLLALMTLSAKSMYVNFFMESGL